MCYAPLRPGRPAAWLRVLEVAGGIVLVAVIVMAVIILRNRSEAASLSVTSVNEAPVAVSNGPGQLALGGPATPFPTLTLTTIPPTRTVRPPETVAPRVEATTPPTATPLPQTGGPPATPQDTYIIQPGDSLLAIAIRHDVTLNALLEANSITNANAMIWPGQSLKIPKTGEPVAEASKAEPGASANAPAEEPASQEPVGRVVHIIRRGDSLWSIANQYGKTVEGLVELNQLKSATAFLGVGQELIIEPGVTATPRPPTATAVPPTATTAPTNTPAPTEPPAPTATPIALPPATRQVAQAEPTAASGGAIVLSKYPAPTLLGVPDKTSIQGKQSSLLLNWTSVGVLATDEYYVIRVSTIRNGKPISEEAWVKATGWRLPETLQLPEKATEPMTLTWDVTVKRATGKTAEGKLSGPPISPTSQTFEFTWMP